MDNNNINNENNLEETEAKVTEEVAEATAPAESENEEPATEATAAEVEAEAAPEATVEAEEAVESKVETFVPHVEEEEDVHFNLASMEELKKFFGSKKWKGIWDKITTGILIVLMASPILILAYIFMWFIFK